MNCNAQSLKKREVGEKIGRTKRRITKESDRPRCAAADGRIRLRGFDGISGDCEALIGGNTKEENEHDVQYGYDQSFE